MQSGDEEGVDCGGTYCPPCSTCSGEPANKYAPPDTGCDHAWPTDDGPKIDINTSDDACELIEVCNPDLDHIVEDALLCCEHESFAPLFAGHQRASDKIAACTEAQMLAYEGNYNAFNPTRLKRCLGNYIIQGMGPKAVYMQGYFHGEWCCYGHDEFCPSGCSKFVVRPAAWQMGTSVSCAGASGAQPDFQMGGHQCEYYWVWAYKHSKGWYKYKWGKHGDWDSDLNYQSNSDSVIDLPAHASIERLSTGTCVDYAIALTTLLRKSGYAKNEAYAVDGEGHDYNLVRFPGDSEWYYVDTTGNGSGIKEWPLTGYNYCHNMDEGCYNDRYSPSQSNCPPNSQIHHCTFSSALTSDGEASLSPPAPVEPASVKRYVTRLDVAAQTCTELSPCTEPYTETVGTPASPVALDVGKTIVPTEIVLGESLNISVQIANKEKSPVNVAARETFISGVAYDLATQEGTWEGYTYQYHDWSVPLAAGASETLTFTAAPSAVGYYSFNPTSIAAGGSVYQATAPMVKVVCSPNGTCDPGETHLFCPDDCQTGIADGYCDMVSDRRIDPDCQYTADPDHNPSADTDGDGVRDGSDACPLTPAESVVDRPGCACGQKICADDDPATVDRCRASTAACEHLPDGDLDEVPDGEDNCPDDYNPDQTDGDGDGVGDQCAIGPVATDITLDSGTYYISDSQLTGAIVISASNVLLDCAGATIVGSGTGYGVYIPDHVSNVTVKNCTIRNYRYGIYADNTSGNALIDNTLELNTQGVMLGYATDNTVTGNTADHNAFAGIYMEGATGNQVTSNTLHANDSAGLFIQTSSGNTISGNSVCQNADTDFAIADGVNTGDNNTCSRPHDWNDAGTTGCSYVCVKPRLYLPVIVKSG
jgi:parallel beta-helix repeat protein